MPQHIEKIIIHRGPKPKKGNKRWLTTIHSSSDVTFTSGQRYSDKRSAISAAFTLIEKIKADKFSVAEENARTGQLVPVFNGIFGAGGGSSKV